MQQNLNTVKNGANDNWTVFSSSSIGHDLAVASLCNHTIISYGTFSLWVGFLAGGIIMSPFHFPEYRYYCNVKNVQNLQRVF